MERELRFDKINLDTKTADTLKLHFQKYLFGIFLMLVNGGMMGQIVFSENMGTPTGTTSIASNSFQNLATLNYANGAQTNSADVRISSPSTGYTGSSAGGNVWFTTTSGAYGFSIENISASTFTSLNLQFGYYKNLSSAHATFSVDYWDGIAWNNIANSSLALFNETATAPVGWYLSKNVSLPTGAQISGLKIRFVKTGTNGIRIDDVKLSGVEATCTTPTISFASASITKNVGDANFTNVATSSSTGTITYSSNNVAVASVNASSGLVTIGTAGNATITATQLATGTHCAATTTYAITVNSTAPVISTTGTLSAFTTVYGSPSASQNFTISGANLTGTMVTATAPAGFEIANSAGGPFGSTATFAVSGGITSGTVYIRLAQTTAVGTYFGSISQADNTTSATTTKSIPSSNVSPKALTITGISAVSKIYDGTTAVTITGTESYSGLVNSETYPVSGVVSWAFTSKDFGTGINISRTGVYNAPSPNYSVTQPVLNANISKKVLTIAAPVIASKVYDGLVITGTITPGTLSGLIDSETLLTTATGTYSDVNVGVAKPATVVYSLANGTNGGLAVNYSLANGSGSGEITVAAPALTASAIALNVLGIYILPGANITTNSTGVLSYSLTSGGNVTLSGTTLTGNTIGSETLTITQAAFGNYASGSVNVQVNVSAVTYANGDYRTNPNATNPIFFNSTSVSGGVYPWQTWNGSAWVDVTGSSATVSPQALAVKPENIYLNHSSVDLATGAIYKNIIVEGGYVFSGNTTTGLTIEANKSLDIKAGYVLIDGRVSFLANSNLFVRSNGELEIGASSSNLSRNNTSKFVVENSGYVYINNYLANIWTGSENFANGSVFTIYGWLNSQKLFDNESDITSNSTTNAKFGYLNIELASGTLAGNWTYVFPNDVFKLTQNDFQLISNDNYNVSLNYGEMTIENNFIIGGTSSSSFIQAVTQAGNKKLLVKGDVIKNGVIEYRQIAAGSISDLEIGGNFSVNAGKFNLNQSTSGAVLSNLKLKGNVYVSNLATLSSVSNNNNSFNFIGSGQVQTINVLPSNTAYIIFNVNNGAYVQLLNRDFELGTNSKFNVLTNGTLNFGFNSSGIALNITGNGTTGTGFTTQSGATLIITSPQGIMGTSGIIGNVQTNTAPSISQNGNFHFVGKENQVTGTGLTPTTSERYVFVNLLDNTKELRLTNKIGITTPGKLEIQKGILIGEETGIDDKDFYGTGNLIMTDGEYKISTITASPTTEFLPQLSSYATYSLTGGIVHLNGSNANQILSGIPIYKNLTFSGSNVLGNDDKKISKAIEITDKLHIKETAILNSENKGVTGNANVAMDGGRWRISKLTNAQPEISGSYALTGGTMEYYGTGANNNQRIKGGITYHNIDVNATAANANYTNIDEFYNVSPASSIVVTGNLNTNSPAVFKIGSTHNISGNGNIFINPGSTLLYGSVEGIKTSGTTPADGAIRTSGTRNFSTDASYGFIGGQPNMVTGNGIPAQVENLFIAKTAITDNITLSNLNLSVKNKMVFISGNIVTGTSNLQLGTDATNKGTLEHTSGFVKGKMTRWFNGANSGNNSSLFPLGTIDNKNRFVKIEFVSTSAGTLTASMNPTTMGISGVSAISAIPAVGSCPSFSVVSTDEFYWNMIPSGVSGNYSASFTKESIATDLICEMTLLKRDATDWTASGTHIEPTGTSSMVTLSRSGLNGFQDFGFANKRCGATNIWNGTDWSGGNPTASQKIIFAGSYNSTTNGGNINACECEIQSGAIVTIASSGIAPHFLDIQNGLNNNGQLILQNNNSLIQHNDLAVNSGAGIFKMLRETQQVFRFDYTYWSSPVENQDLHLLSPNTFYDKYYSWNAIASPQVWLGHNRAIPSAPTSPSVTMTPGKGFIIRSPQSFSIESPSATPSIFTAEFIGKPNNGIVSVPIVGGTEKWNLIGNPYPSAINANLFLSDDANDDVVEGTIYFWTHNTPLIATPGGITDYSYSPADYAVYNFSGATSTAPAASGSGSGNNNAMPNGFIAAGQSFFIKGTGGGTAVFKNAMRVTNNNNQFFRIAQQNNLQNSEQIELEKHRVWLNISNASGAFSQALVGYIENATNAYDRGYDGEVLGGNSVSLYFINSQKNLSIQGRALPFDLQDQVEIGYKAVIAGNFKIGIDRFDSLFSNQNIYLEDKLLNVIHNLKQSDYHFMTQIGTFNTRFVLRYTNEALGTDDFAMNPNDVIVISKDKTIKVISTKENIDSITIFDLLGRRIYENRNIHTMHFLISEITASQQALIIKVQLENGAKVDKKIIYY